MQCFNITFLPEATQVKMPAGLTLMDAIHEAGIFFDFPCGGGKSCGKCRVRVVDGADEPCAQECLLLSSEDIQDGIRLACKTKIESHMTVELLFGNYRPHQFLVSSIERKMEIKQHIIKRYLSIPKPVLPESRSDWTRLQEELFGSDEGRTNLHVLRLLPSLLHQNCNEITAVQYQNKIIGVEAGNTTDKLLGMAFDVGTTSVIGYLIDLTTSRQLAVVSSLNSQAQYGADVISRVTYSEKLNGTEKLQAEIIFALNNLIDEAVESAGVKKDDIYALSVVGNTCMHHLLLGISPHQIPLAPYVCALNDPLVLAACELNLTINKAGKVFILPNIAGFVGADMVAVLLATKLHQNQGVKLVIDIGTNGEIALGSAEKIVVCSTAAGPAFEGAQITCGMRGAVGAVDSVTFSRGIHYTVIGGTKPQGICGSALLDTIAGLRELGLINRKGKFITPDAIVDDELLCYRDCLIKYEDCYAFVLVDAEDTLHGRPIFVTQQDIRELQMAKGAIATGIKVLTEVYGICMDDIEEVLVAGAFGNYLNIRNACKLGLLPKELEDRVKMIGNAAGAGAKIALLSASEYNQAKIIAEGVQYVELGIYPQFPKIYAESMYL